MTKCEKPLKLHVTLNMYLTRGFSTIPEDRFVEYITRAGLYVQHSTMGKIVWSFTPIKPEVEEDIIVLPEGAIMFPDDAELVIRNRNGKLVLLSEEDEKALFEGEENGDPSELEEDDENDITEDGIQEELELLILWDDLAERNIRGICTIADIYFRSEAATGESGAALIAFNNEGYSEKYDTCDSGRLQMQLNQVLMTFFEASQTVRRVTDAWS